MLMKGKVLQIDLIGVPGCSKTIVKIILQKIFSDKLTLSTNIRPVYSEDEGKPNLKRVFFRGVYGLEIIFLWFFLSFFSAEKRKKNICPFLRKIRFVFNRKARRVYNGGCFSSAHKIWESVFTKVFCLTELHKQKCNCGLFESCG